MATISNKAAKSGGKTAVSLAGIPGPPDRRLLGMQTNLLPLLRDPIGYMLDLHRKYGDVVALTRGDNPNIFVFSPEYNHEVLSDQQLFFNGAVNAPGSPVKIPEGSSAMRLFSGITTMNGARHKQQRRMLMPAFHRQRIDALHDQMIGLIESRAETWQPGTEIDLLREMKALTLAVAVKTILGLDPENEGDHVRASMERWLKLALSFPVVIFPFKIPGTPYHRMLAMSEDLEKEIRAMIARRRAALAKDPTVGADALSLLVQAHDEDGTRLTDDELVGQTTALFIAGHETTASALTWTLFFLMQHPRVYSDLLDELQGVLHGSAPTAEQLSRLPLLDAVINESMRLMPPGLWFLRVAQERYSFGPYEVPANTRILWTPVVVHRDPELYKEPGKFMPERWSRIDPSPYEYMPFGAGPRRCLGATFAIMEMKLALPILLQRFRVQLTPGTRVDLGSSPLAQPRGGLQVRVGRPKGKPSSVEITGNIKKFVELS